MFYLIYRQVMMRKILRIAVLLYIAKSVIRQEVDLFLSFMNGHSVKSSLEESP